MKHFITYTYCSDTNKWYKFDESQPVSVIDNIDHIEETPILFAYEKKSILQQQLIVDTLHDVPPTQTCSKEVTKTETRDVRYINDANALTTYNNLLNQLYNKYINNDKLL